MVDDMGQIIMIQAHHKLGIIVRSDNSGLGIQTRNLCKMLKPSRVLVVNSEPFNGNEQHNEWYSDYECHFTQAWPTNLECARFMRGLTHCLTAETVYNPTIFSLARIHNVKVFIQPNWEFLDHIRDRRMPQPTKWLMPSYWFLEEMQSMFPNTIYLPPPTSSEDFSIPRNNNLSKTGKRRFLHIMGRVASHDRNGTFDVINALKFSTADFELVIRSQFPIKEYMDTAKDERITFEISNIENQSEIYDGFDMMIFPRRYAGLALPMNEALMNAIPVVMSNISPNNKILPSEWLVDAEKVDSFMARMQLDIHKTDYIYLGNKLDWFATMSDEQLLEEKIKAYEIGFMNYSYEVLRDKYIEIMEL